MLVRCINCGFSCQKYGKTKAGSQRWHCKQCNITFTQTIDNTTKCFQAYRTKSVCENPYDTSKYLVL